MRGRRWAGVVALGAAGACGGVRGGLVVGRDGPGEEVALSLSLSLEEVGPCYQGG